MRKILATFAMHRPLVVTPRLRIRLKQESLDIILAELSNKDTPKRLIAYNQELRAFRGQEVFTFEIRLLTKSAYEFCTETRRSPFM